MHKGNIVRINRSLSIPMSEIVFRFSRSGGPGGQNVNKTETKTELRFNVVDSPSLSEDQRTRISKNLVSKISADGILQIIVQDSRSQSQNRETALHRFRELLRGALINPKKRKTTSPTAASQERRLREKKTRGQIKRLRGRSNDM
jgi:ribosome-associated protein